MKKTLIFPSLIMAFCFLMNGTSYGQAYILSSEDDGTDCNDYQFSLVERLTPLLKLANLVGIIDLSSGEVTYHLPTDAAPMFLERTGIGLPLIIPVKNFVYDSNVNGHPVFKMVRRTIRQDDISILCAPYTGPTYFFMEWRLIDQFGNNYPIHDDFYSNPNGIFSCQVFLITCHDCDENLECTGDPNTYPSTYIRPCVDCGGDNADPDNDGGIDHYSNPSQSNPNNQLSLSPNPFGNELNLTYPVMAEGQVSLTIFNSHGKVITNSQSNETIGVYRKRFDTSQWSSGIYYCTIQSGKISHTVKIIKIN